MAPNSKKNLALSVAIIVLVLALLDGWQYGFFTILRFTVFATTAYVAWMAHEDSKESAVWFYGAVAILFNPFIPIHLTRDVWIVIDFVTAVALALSVFLVRLSKGK